MAWTNPRTWVAGETVTAAYLNTNVRDNLNSLRAGIVTSTSAVSNQGPTSGGQEIVGTPNPLTITTDGFQTIELSYSWYNLLETVTGDICLIRLFEGSVAGTGNELARLISLSYGGSINYGGGYIRAVLQPSAGSHTYTSRILRSAGTGTATVLASTTFPATLLARQVN